VVLARILEATDRLFGLNLLMRPKGGFKLRAESGAFFVWRTLLTLTRSRTTAKTTRKQCARISRVWAIGVHSSARRVLDAAGQPEI